METITAFAGSLPPLLQLVFGIFAGLGALKIFMLIVDFIEDRKEGKE